MSATATEPNPVAEPLPHHVRLVADAKAYIEENFHRRIRTADVARAAGLSLFHFHRVFTRVAGETPKSMTARLQIEKAKSLMLAGTPLAEIAGPCGFAHHSAFGTRFKLATWMTPTAWLRSQGRD